MKTSSLRTLMIETRATNLSKTSRETLYSQLVDIANFFHHTIKAPVKKSLTVFLVFGYNRKLLKTFLKSLCPETPKTTHQQKIELDTIQKRLPHVEIHIPIIKEGYCLLSYPLSFRADKT